MKFRTVSILSLAVVAALAVPVSDAQRSPIVPYPETDFVFNDLKTYITSTLDECVRGCMDDRQCVAFTYKKSGMCYLKKGVGSMNHNIFATSGYIASRGMPPPPLPQQAQPAPPPAAPAPAAGGDGLPPPNTVPATGSLRWVPSGAGAALPADAVAGGSEDGQPLVVCRSAYAGGVFPGKVVKGNCDIAHDGQEVPLRGYEVLTGTGARWGAAEPGFKGAFVAGAENGQPVYLCQAEYRGNVHPGRVARGQCDISYAGKEIPVALYQVMYAEP